MCLDKRKIAISAANYQAGWCIFLFYKESGDMKLTLYDYYVHIDVMNRKEYFQKYLQGMASAEEKELLTVWVTGLMERVADGAASEEEQLIVKEWLSREDKAAAAVAEIEKRKNETLLLIEQQYLSLPEKKKRRTVYRYAAAVAFFVLAAGAYLIYQTAKDNRNMTALSFPAADEMQNNNIVYSTRSGDPVKSIRLPDSSFVYLNGNAAVSVDRQKYNFAAREVVLEKGEAFFSVAKNAAKKFTVQFGDLQLEVTGTSFNVENYEHGHEKRVYVKTGTVVIRDREHLHIALAAHETFVYDDHTKKYTVKKDDSADLSQWIDGGMVFAGAGLDEVKQKLENRFKARVVVENDALRATMRLNAAFNKDENMDKIAKVIAGIYGIKYKVEDKKITFY